MSELVSYRNYDAIVASFLVLDFRKPKETRMCLESIKRKVKFAHKTYLLSHGIDSEYPFQLYHDGLCDYLLISRRNSGCGIGTQELFRIVDTSYSVYVQNDQILMEDFTGENFWVLVSRLNSGEYQAIGLAGNNNQGQYSERAHLIKTETYLSIPDKPIGGPGPYDRTALWTEEHVAAHFRDNGWKFGIADTVFFADIGKWSVREFPCGGIIRFRTDTHELEVIQPPKREHSGYDFNNTEWNDMISNQWIKGRVPEKWMAGAFDHYSKFELTKDL